MLRRLRLQVLSPCAGQQPQVLRQAADEHPRRQPLVQAVQNLCGPVVTRQTVERSHEEEKQKQMLNGAGGGGGGRGVEKACYILAELESERVPRAPSGSIPILKGKGSSQNRVKRKLTARERSARQRCLQNLFSVYFLHRIPTPALARFPITLTQ